MAGCRINLCYEELVIARSRRLTVSGRPTVGSNGCETIVHRLIDVRKLVVTRSMPLGDLWPAGFWDRTGVDVVAAWFGWVCTLIHVFVVWVECVKALLVNVCNGTAKSAEIGSRDMRVSTGQYADCAGERIPLYTPVWMCGRSF